MAFDLTTPYPLADASPANFDQPDDGAPLQAWPDHILAAPGLPPDGSIDQGAVDSLLHQSNGFLSWLNSQPSNSGDSSAESAQPAGVPVLTTSGDGTGATEVQSDASPQPLTATAATGGAPARSPPTIDEILAAAGHQSGAQPSNSSNAPAQDVATLTPSDQGAQFIRDYEKLGPVDKSHTTTYEYGDAVKKPTIGWGHLLPKSGTYPAGVSLAQAGTMFKSDLEKYANLVKSRVKVPLNQNQFDAVTSLAYNAPSALKPRSGFLTALNNKDYQGAAAIIPQYNKGRVSAVAPLKVIPGLTTRRNAEQAMFLNGTYNSNH